MKPPRIAHALHVMDRGGIETWLMNLLRTNDPTRLHMDFFVHSERAGAYDAEITQLGGRIHRLPHAHRPLAYAAALRRMLIENGPYQAVHSHLHYYSGSVLRVAAQAGVPIRIAHSHTAPPPERLGPFRNLYVWLMRRRLRRYATIGLAASRLAAANLYGETWEADGRWGVLPYGIDLHPFTQPMDRTAIRHGFGFTENDLVVGHVGRFVPVKNHAFLLQIAAALVRRRPNVRLLLIGDGPLRRQMEERTKAMGLSATVVFAGLRDDIPFALRAMDAFVFPSFYEGLPMAVIEAQTAGLSVVLSDTITEEVTVLPDRVRRLPINAPSETWADAILDMKSADRESGLSAVKRSPFNLALSRNLLEGVYRGERPWKS